VGAWGRRIFFCSRRCPPFRNPRSWSDRNVDTPLLYTHRVGHSQLSTSPWCGGPGPAELSLPVVGQQPAGAGAAGALGTAPLFLMGDVQLGRNPERLVASERFIFLHTRCIMWSSFFNILLCCSVCFFGCRAACNERMLMRRVSCPSRP